MSDSSSLPHVVVFPTAGSGHLMPFLRFAATLVRRGCQVTLITARPTVSMAESRLISRFLDAFPHVTDKHLNFIPLDETEVFNTTDAFVIQWQAINRSGHLLTLILSSLSRPASVLISDITLIASTIPVTSELKIPNFVLFISSVRMSSVLSNFPAISENIQNSDSFLLDSVIEVKKSSFIPEMLDPDATFTKSFKESSFFLRKADGLLIISFLGLETEAIQCQRPNWVFTLGPFLSEEFERGASEGATEAMGWLDRQPVRSVVYVSFGSSFALETKQIRELASGLVMSEAKFLWVVKSKSVDREEKESIDKIVGREQLERIKKLDHGFVLRGWVSQADVLGHRAVGGYMSHCGWGSVVEAAWNGVPVMAWPLGGGDQKINAEVVEAGGWGRTMRGWSRDKDVMVKAEDVAETVKEVMESEGIKSAAAAVREAARKAVQVGGSGDANLEEILQMWNTKITPLSK